MKKYLSLAVAAAVVLGVSSVAHAGSPIYGTAYTVTVGDTKSVFDGKRLEVNQSNLKASAVGANAAGKVTVVNDKNVKTDVLVGSLALGDTTAKMDLSNSTLNGGYSASGEQNGSVGLGGIGADGATSIEIDGKSTASVQAVGGNSSFEVISVNTK